VDGLSAIIAERKETLKAELAAGAESADASRAGVSEHLDELRFEVAELRGRFESMQASLDAILEHTKGTSSDGPAGKA
jgi:predicted aminopeptidase